MESTRTRAEPTRARRRFGQHFLEPAWVEKLVRAVEPDSTQTFLEIGPGRGALTRPLSAKAAHVVAFEIDRDLVGMLRAAEVPRLTIVQGDFLETTVESVSSVVSPVLPRVSAGAGLAARELRVVGNLPYNVASPILFKLVELYSAGLPITDAVVMLQREVAERLLAAPGHREYGVLSVLIGRWARVERLLALPPGAFRPAPQVHSTVVRLRFRLPEPQAKDESIVRGLVQAVFTRRRKTLANALLAYPRAEQASPAVALSLAQIDGRRRPETLEIEEFVRLADVLRAFPPSEGGPAVL